MGAQQNTYAQNNNEKKRNSSHTRESVESLKRRLRK